jgi:ribulose-5-phosphate 4-epimerase/fuculose-1-phosphate aldolase
MTKLDDGVALESRLRIELTAAFRWAARLGLHESIANHFSVALSDDGRQFLLNPVGRHFARLRASELLRLDVDQPDSYSGPQAPDPTAWHLHAELHQRLPQARCILHTHMRHATALACLQDFEFLMLDQNACRFYQRIAYDRGYAGMALEAAEGARIAALLSQGKNVLFMGNHGVMVIGPSVATAFDELYYLEKAAELQVLAMSTGRPLSLIPNKVAAQTCAQWQAYPTRFSEMHLNELMAILDDEAPSYKT